MTIGMWFTDDLANLLRGLALAALPAGDSEYQAGFQAALCAVAMALGIPFAPASAMLLTALLIHGAQTGPLLMVNSPEIFWGVTSSR